MEILIEAKDLQACYNIGPDLYVHAVGGVSLSIKKNEIIGIAGESGCGKSTLIKVLCALVKPPLTLLGGKVWYYCDGGKIDILSCDEDELRALRWKLFSFVPQGAMDSLNPTLKIEKVLLETIHAHQKSGNKEKTQESIKDIFEKCGLSKAVLRLYPTQLSGGMRQRVVIALAIMLKPEIIFCDEPTSALDLVTQRGILQLLQEVQKDLQNTLVLVSHDMGIHALVADRMAIMYAGKIVELAPTEAIFAKPYHPYTKALINSLPTIGDESRKIGLGGAPPSLVNPPKGCRFSPRCPLSTHACGEKETPLVEIEPDHYVACHRFGG